MYRLPMVDFARVAVQHERHIVGILLLVQTFTTIVISLLLLRIDNLKAFLFGPDMRRFLLSLPPTCKVLRFIISLSMDGDRFKVIDIKRGHVGSFGDSVSRVGIDICRIVDGIAAGIVALFLLFGSSGGLFRRVFTLFASSGKIGLTPCVGSRHVAGGDGCKNARNKLMVRSGRGSRETRQRDTSQMLTLILIGNGLLVRSLATLHNYQDWNF